MRRTYEWGHDRFPRLLDCRPIYAGDAVIDAGFDILEEQTISLWGLPVAVLVAGAPAG